MREAATPQLAGRVAPSNGPTLWALAGFGLFVLGGFVMLFVSLAISETVLGAVGIDASAGTIGLSIRNAAHPIGWGAFVAAASIPIGRRLVPGVRFGAGGRAVLAVGLLLATVATFLGIEFVRERLGYFGSRAQGFSGVAAPAIVAIALAGWATLAAPRDRARPLAVTTLAAVAILGLSLIPSVDGLRDGIDQSSIPLAVVLALGVAYAAMVSVVVVRRSS